MFPLISVIVPIYNVESYLDRGIKSLVNQTYKNLEIILVDDGSSDGSLQLCDKWAEKDSRIKAFHKENGGAASARNFGLDNAAGEYIGFLDADDYLDTDMYEIMMDEILSYEADSASCGMVRESKNGYKEVWGSDDLSILSGRDVLKLVGEANGILPVHVGNKLFRKDIINDIRFDTNFKFAEDTLFNFRVAKNIKKMVIHNVARYHYTNNDTSITHKCFGENHFDEQRVMDLIFREADEETLPYCLKGDIMKSLRTIKQMCTLGAYLERYNMIRKRVVDNIKFILTSPFFGKMTKIQAIVLFLFPNTYKVLIRCRGKRNDKKFAELTGAEYDR